MMSRSYHTGFKSISIQHSAQREIFPVWEATLIWTESGAVIGKLNWGDGILLIELAVRERKRVREREREMQDSIFMTMSWIDIEGKKMKRQKGERRWRTNGNKWRREGDISSWREQERSTKGCLNEKMAYSRGTGNWRDERRKDGKRKGCAGIDCTCIKRSCQSDFKVNMLTVPTRLTQRNTHTWQSSPPADPREESSWLITATAKWTVSYFGDINVKMCGVDFLCHDTLGHNYSFPTHIIGSCR